MFNERLIQWKVRLIRRKVRSVFFVQCGSFILQSAKSESVDAQA